MATKRATAPAKTKARPATSKAADGALVDRLRAICLALPEANERLSHGEPTWFAGKGKVFAMLDNHHHGAEHLAVWLPQPLGAQESLIEADPSLFFRPPYVGPSGWVGVILDRSPDWSMVTGLIHDAYRHVATHKLRAELEARTHAPGAATEAPRPERLSMKRVPNAAKRRATRANAGSKDS